MSVAMATAASPLAPSVRYVVTAEPFFRFLPGGSVEVRSAAKTLRIPQPVFQVLMQFAEPRTIAEVAQHVATELAAGLPGVIDELVARDLLAPAHAAGVRPESAGESFGDLFRSGVFDEVAAPSLARHLSEGRAIVVSNALRPDVATRLHEELEGELMWQGIDEVDQISHYRFRSLDFERHLPSSVRDVRRLADSSSAKRLMSRLSGCDCDGPIEFSASWYKPGDYTHPHNDNQSHRSIVCVINLTKDWDPRWGGGLFWAQNGVHVMPRFNTLTLFNVTTASVHQVTPVSPLALRKRLTLNIWWTNKTPPPIVDRNAKSRADAAGVTPHAYGRSPVVLPDGIVVV